MSNPLRSNYQAASSAPTASNQRAKSLPLQHATIIRNDASRSSAPMRDSSRNENRDSANMQAARLLRISRLESGLTQEQAAAQSGCQPSTVVRREHGAVDLGPLRQWVLLERAREAKLKGGK